MSVPLLSSLVNSDPVRKSSNDEEYRPSPMAYLDEPFGIFSVRGAHPEERSDEGSHVILLRLARQDEGSNTRKNTMTPHLDERSFNLN